MRGLNLDERGQVVAKKQENEGAKKIRQKLIQPAGKSKRVTKKRSRGGGGGVEEEKGFRSTRAGRHDNEPVRGGGVNLPRDAHVQ